MTRSRFPAVLLLAGLAASASAGWWDEAGAARRATLAEVRKDAERWRDVPLLLDVRFSRTGDAGNAYFTRFTAREWRAVLVFPADATPESMGRDAAFDRAFVRRGSENERRLDAVAKGGRVQLRAAVRDAVKGEPWMEVLDVVADGDPLSPEEGAQLSRADELFGRDNAPAAEPMYRALLASRTLPKAVQAQTWRKIAAASRARRHIEDSADACAAALAIEPDDSATAELLAAARALLAARTAAAPEASASVAPAAPTPPAPARRLLPPAGIGADAGDEPPPAAPAKRLAPPVAAPPAAAPQLPPPTTPAEEPPPPPAPKPLLAGPK